MVTSITEVRHQAMLQSYTTITRGTQSWTQSDEYYGNITFTSGTNVTEQAVRSLNVINPGTVHGDHKTPNAHAFTRRHAEVVSSDYYDARASLTNGHRVVNRHTGDSLGFYEMYEDGPLLGELYSRTDDRVLEKIFDSLRGNNEIVIDALEGHQTLKMLRGVLSFRDLFGRFSKQLIRSIYKRNPKLRGSPHAGQVILDEMTSRWLELRYGWTPLLSSIYDAIELVHRPARPKEVFVKHRSSASIEIAETLSGSGTFDDPYVKVTGSRMSRTEMGIRFAFPDTSVKLQDWTSLNPVAITWQLLPLSFVGDWFFNVSQYMRNLEGTVLFSSAFDGGYKTNSSKEDLQYIRYGETNENWAFLPGSEENGSGYYIAGRESSRREVNRVVRTTKNRSVLYSLPWPVGIRLQTSLNTKRAMDAAALVHTLVGKRSRGFI